LNFGGCISGSSPVCAKACEAEAATATVPAAAMNSRRSMSIPPLSSVPAGIPEFLEMNGFSNLDYIERLEGLIHDNSNVLFYFYLHS
jgi:hypothetical protein